MSFKSHKRQIVSMTNVIYIDVMPLGFRIYDEMRYMRLQKNGMMMDY